MYRRGFGPAVFFRKDKAMSEKPRVPTWGYNDDGGKIFDLAEGQKLPAGYVDTPAKVKPKD